MYKVIFTPKAKRILDKLDVFERNKIQKQLLKLELAPHHFSKPLSGHDLRSFKVGVSGYRLILEINEGNKTVFIVALGKRRSVYRNY